MDSLAPDEALRGLLKDEPSRGFLLRFFCEASVGRLVPGVAHRLRNPLNSILGGAQLLEEKGEEAALRDKLLPVMLRSSQRIGDMLDALDPNEEASSAGLELTGLLDACLHVLGDRTMNVEVEREPELPLRIHGQGSTAQAMVLSVLQTHLACRPTRMRVRTGSQSELARLCIENEGVESAFDSSGFEFLMQTSLANSLGGSLSRSVSNQRTTLLLPLAVP